MKNLILLSFAAFILSFVGCKSSDTHKLTIASEMGNCMGVAPQKCLLIKDADASTWQLWYSGIEGFDHQAGFEYVVEVRKETIANPPADASSMKYVLVKIISKVEKQSEGLPASALPAEITEE